MSDEKSMNDPLEEREERIETEIKRDLAEIAKDTFSSAGSTMSVDCRSPARISGGVAASETITVRGTLGWSGWASVAAWTDGAAMARLKKTAMGIGGRMRRLLSGIRYSVSPCAKRAMPSLSP